MKREIPELKHVSSQVLQEVLQRLDRAFKHFFDRVKRGEKPGFPRFKSKHLYNSFTLKLAGNWKADTCISEILKGLSCLFLSQL